MCFWGQKRPLPKQKRHLFQDVFAFAGKGTCLHLRLSGSGRLRCKPSTGGFALRSVSSPHQIPYQTKNGPFRSRCRLREKGLAFTSRLSGSDRLRCKPSTGGFALRSVSSPYQIPYQTKNGPFRSRCRLREKGLEPSLLRIGT